MLENRGISADAFQGDYVVDDVARTWAFGLLGGWAWMFALEGCPGGLATLYAHVGVAVDGWD